MTFIRQDVGLIYGFLRAKCIDLSLIIDYSTYTTIEIFNHRN